MKRNKAILAILLIILISSCHTAKNALNKVKKADLYHPEVVAEYTRTKYPCKLVDSIVKYDTSYDFVEIQCPDYSQVNDTIYLTKYVNSKAYNLSNNGKSKTDKPQPKQMIANRTITKEVIRDVIDSACYKEVDVYIQQNKDLSMTINDKNDWIKWLLIILCISILINFIQSRK